MDATSELFEWRRPAVPDAYSVSADGLTLYQAKHGQAETAYKPLMEESGLFLNFAQIKPDPEGVVAFANHYGMLGLRGVRLRGEESGNGEPVELWLGLRAWMAENVRLWQLALGEKPGPLAESFKRWKATGLTYIPPQAGSAPTAAKNESINISADDLLGDLGTLKFSSGVYSLGDSEADGQRRAAAMYVVGHRLAKYLRADSWPGSRAVAVVGFRWQPGNSRSMLTIEPGCLMTAMVLQMANAVTRGLQFRACRECGRWYELSAAVNRTNRYTCSTACRKRAYRHRIAKAKELHSKATSVRDIAKLLHVKPDRVKRWISGDVTP